MKKRYYIFIPFLSLLLLLCSCHRTAQTSPGSPAASEQLTPTYGEIYPDDAFKENTAVHAFSTSAYDGVLISYLNECVEIVDLNRSDTVLELCHDPTCNHSALSCLKYASRSCTTAICYDGIVYLTRYIDGGKGGLDEEVIAYNLKTGAFTVIQKGEAFLLLCRMGRYLYYYESIFSEQLDSGKVVHTCRYYRYDIVDGQSVFLYESKSENAFRSFTAYEGLIYALNVDGDLIICDADFRFRETVLPGHKISFYEIGNGSIYYLSKSDPSSDSGGLYEYNMISAESTLIVENATLFSLDGNMLYYTLYNPVPAFEWDYPVANASGVVEIRSDGQNETHRVMIESPHGNEIYAYDTVADKSELQGYPIGSPDAYLGTAYYVRNGRIVSQFKAPYAEGQKLGMRTGVGIFDLDNSFTPLIEFTMIY